MTTNASEASFSLMDEQAASAVLAEEGFRDALGASLAALGACFFASPRTERGAMALALVRSVDVASDWPFGSEAERADAARLIACGEREDEDDALAAEFARLFVGPHALAAPPWGSVYMDRDKVTYGRTWLLLRDFMRAHGIESLYEEREPEDQFGRLLMLCSEVARNRPELLCELLGDHVLCWSGHYLDAFEKTAELATYRGLAILVRATLDGAGSELGIVPARRRFYR